MFDSLPNYKEQLKQDKKNLSDVSKMPGKSISRSAYLCHVGQKLRKVKGSTCEKCYACKSMYNMPNVKESRRNAARFSSMLWTSCRA